jgi:PIN domain nuclease of toxin-antitoxin system
MRILLDTHILYWWFYETSKLSKNAVAIVQEAEEVFVSSASVWELAIKSRLGKINADPQQVLKRIEKNDFIELPVYFRHAALVATLPLHHADPFDRLLIAQAISEPLNLLTADPKLKAYSELVLQV